MVFDNRKIVLRLNKRRYLAILLYLVIMGFLLIPDSFKKTILGYEKSLFVIVLTTLYILYVIYTYVMNYNFFSYNNDGNNLIIRFVSLRPFDNKKRAIEVNKNDFVGYKIKSSLFNLKQDLVIKIKTKNGIANYPPISISALSFNHRKVLEDSLSQKG
ncbi:MAG: hypothetical protein GQ564_01315 [Bacteroidales bacterium]|nr:hypothetical protein [Bacteroidales bacterium]